MSSDMQRRCMQQISAHAEAGRAASCACRGDQLASPPQRDARRRTGRRSGRGSSARCRTAAPTCQVRGRCTWGLLRGARGWQCEERRLRCLLASAPYPFQLQHLASSLHTLHPLLVPLPTDVHVFALANVLRRPLLIFADNEAALAGLSGIYLPCLWPEPRQQCSRQPLSILFGCECSQGWGHSRADRALTPWHAPAPSTPRLQGATFPCYARWRGRAPPRPRCCPCARLAARCSCAS